MTFRILIADDNEDDQALISHIAKKASCETLTASNGKIAQEIINSQDIDLLICDVFMPEQEGVETMMNLHKEFPGLPVIAVSGTRTEYLESMVAFGASMALVKPVDPTALLDTIQGFIQTQ